MTTEAQQQPDACADPDPSTAAWPMLQPVTLDREWLRRRAVKLEEPTRTDELTPAS